MHRSWQNHRLPTDNPATTAHPMDIDTTNTVLARLAALEVAVQLLVLNHDHPPELCQAIESTLDTQIALHSAAGHSQGPVAGYLAALRTESARLVQQLRQSLHSPPPAPRSPPDS